MNCNFELFYGNNKCSVIETNLVCGEGALTQPTYFRKKRDGKIVHNDGKELKLEMGVLVLKDQGSKFEVLELQRCDWKDHKYVLHTSGKVCQLNKGRIECQKPLEDFMTSNGDIEQSFISVKKMPLGKALNHNSNHSLNHHNSTQHNIN